jgi:pimeloyl-ACP methyl ester carboxylesterase
MNWLRFGHAQALADAGFEVIMPDLRAHGESAAPHDPAAYPPGVLVRDVAALVKALGLAEFDLVGFSLGARTAAAAVVTGLAPRRLVLAGMGIEGLAGWVERSAFFLDAIDRFDQVKQGDPAYLAVQFMKTMKTDRVAARLLLQSVEDIDAGDLARIAMPTLVLCGEQDRDNGSPEALAAALRDARLEFVPGTHMGSVTQPELGHAIARFLGAAG